MQIGTLANRTGVSRRLLRYYEEQGLLRPLRLSNGYREYAESDVAAVRHIRLLLAVGLPTAVIARLVHCLHDDGERIRPSGCPEMIASLQRQRRRIAQTITELRSSEQMLDNMLADVLRATVDAPEPVTIPGE